MLKKLESSDVFVNRIKTYPKVRIFTYSGSMYYNDSVVSGSGVKLFDFLMEPLPTAPVITGPILLFTETYEYPDWFGTYDTGSIVIPTFSGSATFTETYEYPDWFGTYDTGSIVVPTFSGSATFTETYEYPDWFGTYDTGSIVVPTFSCSATFTEEFESGSWPNP